MVEQDGETKTQQRQHANSILYVWTQRFQTWRNWEGWRPWFGQDSHSFLCRKQRRCLWKRCEEMRQGLWEKTGNHCRYIDTGQRRSSCNMQPWVNDQMCSSLELKVWKHVSGQVWLVLEWVEIKTNKGDDGSKVRYYLREQGSGSGPEAVGGGRISS